MPDHDALRAGCRTTCMLLMMFCPCLTLATADLAESGHPAEDATVSYLQAAAAYLQSEEFDAAAAVLDEALQRQEACPELLTLRSQVHQRQGELERAASLAEEALAMQPDFAPAHLQLGDVLQSRGDLAGAAQAYRQAIALQPRCAVAHCGLAEVLLSRGDVDQAAASARLALGISPGLARAHACLSRACLQGDDYLGAYGHAVKAEQSGLDMSEVWTFLQGDQ